MPGFVYRWTNKINGMMYVGSHKGTTNDGYTGSGTIFLRAIQKYGIESFTREILEHVQNDDILVYEQRWLDKLNCAKSKSYYNIAPTAGGGNLGQDYSLIAERMKKNNPNSNYQVTKRYIEKHGHVPWIGFKQSEYQKKIVSEMMKRNNPSKRSDYIPTTCRVMKVCPETNTIIKTYNSLQEALNIENLSSAHHYKFNSEVPWKGYIWRKTERY